MRSESALFAVAVKDLDSRGRGTCSRNKQTPFKGFWSHGEEAFVLRLNELGVVRLCTPTRHPLWDTCLHPAYCMDCSFL